MVDDHTQTNPGDLIDPKHQFRNTDSESLVSNSFVVPDHRFVGGGGGGGIAPGCLIPAAPVCAFALRVSKARLNQSSASAVRRVFSWGSEASPAFSRRRRFL